ncbi:MAG: hypothetical protein RJA77_157 [Pseudomonadota bacterium]
MSASPPLSALRIADSGWLEPQAGVYHWASPHADARPAEVAISLLVIHCISLPRGQYGGSFIRDLFMGCLDCSADPSFESLSGLRVSSHFLIDRAGGIHQFVPIHQRAWHAGRSSFQGRSACNDFSIGIELEGVDDGPYLPAQEQQCLRLTLALARACPSLQWMAGHSDIAPGRKTDPGPGWDWQRFQGALDQALGQEAKVHVLKYFFHG